MAAPILIKSSEPVFIGCKATLWCQMEQETLEDVCSQVDELFWGDSKAVVILGKEYRPFRMGKIHAIDIAELGLKFLQQNPDKISRRTGKPSDGARAARLGHRVVWILVDGKYSGAGVLDGRYTASLHWDLKLLATGKAN